MEMEIGKEGFGVCNDTFDKPLKPTGLATSTINQERHHIPPLLEAVQETMESYKELQEENSKLKQLLEQQLAEVERVHVVILEENEVLSKENLELRGKVEEQRKLLEKNEMERNLLEGKLDAIKKRFLKMNWAFAGLAKEIEGGGGSLRRNEKDMEDATMATQKMGDLPNCVLPDLPVSSWTSNMFSSEKAEVHQEDAGSARGISKCSEEAIVPQVDVTPSCSAAVGQSEESSGDHHITMTTASLSFAATTPNRVPVKKQNKKLIRHGIDTSRQDEGHFCVCGHSSSRNYDLIRHVNKFNARNGFRFNCPVDKREQGFSSPSNLKAHRSDEQHGTGDPSRNEVASTPKPSKKLKHAVDCNRQQEGLYCACGRRFSLKKNLTRHINHFNSKVHVQGKFVCSVKGCGKRFYTTSNLKVHMKKRHKLEYTKTNGCTRCGETFSTLTLFTAHYKTRHQSVTHAKEAEKGVTHGKDLSKTDASGHTCLCGRKFSSKERLSSHVYYHSGGFNFKCDVCGNRYRVTSALRLHMKLVHKMKYFGNGCKACGRVFPDMSALLEHRKSHLIGGTNEIPMGGKSKDGINAITPSLPILTPHDLSNQIPASISSNVTLAHGELEENSDSNSFPCLCGSQFEDKSGLMDHIRLMMVFAKL